MAQIKFYRGASGVTLPNYQDGAVFIVANGTEKDKIPLGDMYVDVPGSNNTGERLHIIPQDAIYYKTASDWESSEEWGDISVANKIYVKINVVTENETVIKRELQIAIGDGTTAIGVLNFQDWVHGIEAATATPSAVGILANTGTSDKYAREDHIHSITSAAITAALGYVPPTSNTTYAAGTTAAKNVATTSSAGTTAAGTPYAAWDHVHKITKATITAVLELTPSAAAAKGVVTAITSASEDLPTSKAVNTAINAAVSAAVSAAANQNAFSNIKVGTTTVAADTTTDTFELAAGTNITLTADTTNDKITVSATDTKYIAASSVSAVGTSAVTGTSTAYARADHVHNITSATITSALGFTPANANDLPSGSMVFKGVTTAAINDGSTTEPTDIYTGSATPKAGDVIAYNSKEFVWGGSPSHWIEFGDFSDLQNALGNFAYADEGQVTITPSGTLTVTLPTTSKNVVSSVSTGTVVTAVTTAAQTMVTGITTAAQTIATSGTSTNITVTGEKLVIPSAVLTGVTTTSINKVTAVSTASKNVVSSIATGTAVTAISTAAQTMVTGQPSTATFAGNTVTLTVNPSPKPQ